MNSGKSISFIIFLIKIITRLVFIIKKSVLKNIQFFKIKQYNPIKTNKVPYVFLSGLGSAGIIYLLQFFEINIIIKCLLGGYSSLIVTPISTIIRKEITPILETITNGIKEWITSYFKKKSNEK